MTAGPAPLVVERVFDAPRELVWKALTEADRMRHWYLDLVEFRAEVGFEFEFLASPPEYEKFRHLCRVTAVVPGERIAYTWRYHGYEGGSQVIFDLDDVEGGTRVRLTHEGLETFPQSGPFARENFEAGWNMLVGESLKRFTETELFIERVFDAPRESVFQMWTDYRLLATWAAPHGFEIPEATGDLRVGGAWRTHMVAPDGITHIERGTYREIVPPERLVFTHEWEQGGDPGPETVVTVRLEESDGRTRMTFHQAGFATRASRDGHDGGWSESFERLATILRV